MKRIIYHYPSPLVKNPKSGSQVRPIAMLKAFRDLGYEVDIVSGYSNERSDKIRQIKNNILKGVKYEFMYCENTTMPTQLTDPSHLPLRPFIDFNFIKFLRSHNVPVGLFYRDIHWKFPIYNESVSLLKSAFAKFFYKRELYFYSRNLDKLYLPSFQMAKYLNEINSDITDTLPPGHENYSYSSEPSIDSTIKVLYVGGLSDFYDISLFFDTIKNYPQIELTICTRIENWNSIEYKYTPLPPNVNIVHKSGPCLKELYEKHNLALLYVKPSEYWRFAVPIKLLEYVGERKPVIVSSEIWSSDFINRNHNGWVVDYNEKSLNKFLSSLSIESIEAKKEACENCALDNTWLSRAKKVSSDLTNL